MIIVSGLFALGLPSVLLYAGSSPHAASEASLRRGVDGRAILGSDLPARGSRAYPIFLFKAPGSMRRPSELRSHSFRVFFTALTVLSAGLLIDSIRFLVRAWQERSSGSIEIQLPFLGEVVLSGQEELQGLVFLFVPIDLACLVAIPTVLAILWRGRRKPDSDSLAVFLSVGVFLCVGPQAAMVPHLLGRPVLTLLGVAGQPRLLALFHTAWFASFGLALAALLRFSVFFPKTLSSSDVRVYAEREEVRDSMRWIERAFVLPLRFFRLVTPFLPRDETSHPLSWEKRVIRGGEREIRARQKLLSHIVSGRLWVIVFLAPAIAGVMALSGARGSWVFAVVLVFNAVSYFLLLDIIEFMRMSYHVAEPDERRKVLWVVEGLFSAFWVFLLCGVPVFVTWRAEFVLVGLGTGVLVFVLSLAVAVFYAGAVDPTLAIRGTTVYGTLGVLFIILFAVVESLVSEVVEARLGLPDMAGAAASGALVAAIVLPLRGRLSGVVSRLIPLTGDRADEHQGHEVR